MDEEIPVTNGPDREPTHPCELLRDDVLLALRLNVNELAGQLGA